jgi:hypothetical protein
MPRLSVPISLLAPYSALMATSRPPPNEPAHQRALHDGEGGLSASVFRRLLSQPYRQGLAAAARGWRGAIPPALAR